MSIGAIVLAASLGFVCILVVAWPYLRSDEADDALEQLDELELEQLALLESRDRAIAALQELETDHREGKMDDADYRVLVSQLRADAARSIAALDAARGESAHEASPSEDGSASADVKPARITDAALDKPSSGNEESS